MKGSMIGGIRIIGIGIGIGIGAAVGSSLRYVLWAFFVLYSMGRPQPEHSYLRMVAIGW